MRADSPGIKKVPSTVFAVLFSRVGQAARDRFAGLLNLGRVKRGGVDVRAANDRVGWSVESFWFLLLSIFFSVFFGFSFFFTLYFFLFFLDSPFILLSIFFSVFFGFG